MTAPSPAPPDQAPHVLRDDNLRLVFAVAEAAAIEERLDAVRAGSMLLVIVGLASVLFAIAAIEAGDLSALPFLVRALAALLWLFGAAVTVFSPLLALMLVTEYRRARRDRQALAALLRRYGRSWPGA